MNRIKFLSIILLFTVSFLFAVKFAFYPVSSFFLDIYGIRYDFSKIDYEPGRRIVFEDLSVEIKDLLSFKAGKLAFSIGRKSSGFLEKEYVLHYLELIDGDLTFDSKWLLEPSDITFPETFPFFPLEEVFIKNFRVSAMINEKNGLVVQNIDISGNEKYEIEMPDNKYFHPSLKEPVIIDLYANIEAKDFFYAIENIAVSSKGMVISGEKKGETGNLSGRVAIDLSEAVEIFSQTAKGEVYADYVLDIAGKVPRIDATVTVSGLNYEGFRPWDIHAFLQITPTVMYIDRLNLFHNDKVFLSLDGIFPYKAKKIKGVTKLYRFDLDDCLRRMTTSGIVNLIVSGKADYVFSTETLSADVKTDLVVNEFDVGKKEILDLPREVFVTGNVTVGADGVKLHDGIVKTKDETSRLIVKDSWFGFADSMKFHIPVVAGSWINLEDVNHITGFNLKGRGSVEALVTSFYENPFITGRFSGTGCSFHGFNSQSCTVDTKLKEFVLRIGIEDIRQNSISSKDSFVSLDFNDEILPVSFLINDAKGSLKDAAAVFDIQTDAFSGNVALTAEGVYKNGLSKLNASLKADNLKIKGVKAADSFVFKITDKDPVFINGTGTLNYGKSSLKIEGKMSKKDLDTDISASFASFFKDDFPLPADLDYEEPFLDIKLSGILDHPDISARFESKGISFSGVKLGDLSVSASLAGENMDFHTKGKLGERVVFSASMKEFKPESLSASLKVKDFVHKVSDFFVKFSLNAKMEGENIDARVTTLMAEKSGFFVRNNAPFNISGKMDNLEIEKAYFDGETANFCVEGKIVNYSPQITAKGTLFPRMVEILYPGEIKGVDGKFYFDIALDGEKIKGDIRMVEGSYRLKNPQIVLSGFNGVVSFDNKKWKIESLSGFAGGGKVVVKGEGSMFPFDNASLNLKLVNVTGRYALTGDFGLSSNLDIIMFGPEQISVSGDIELRNIVYNQPLSLDSDFIKMISKLGRGRAGAEIEKTLPIDLSLRVTGKNNIRIKTNLIESDLFIDTNITGTARKPEISGTILLKNGNIQYKQNSFLIQRGIITFEDGNGINPFIDLESYRNVTAKVVDDEKDFKIIMTARGNPFEGELEVNFDSIPQLDQQQLVSLLLWGNIGDSFSGDIAIAAVTDIMGITTQVRKNFNLTKFELIPKYSEFDDKTVLKLVAEKEIYKNLFLSLESNPSDTTDQIIEIKYKTKSLETILGWKNKDRLESSFGAIGFDFRLEYYFE
ncbi:MAG TPA: translocation/assembly module TamB domain-containing protein [bacterium]|nr:translocation/assembly module TamB domain-containing protein [bacterium]